MSRSTQVDMAVAEKDGGMDLYTAVALAEGFQDGDDDEVIEAWQYLVDSGHVWHLQGSFGRQAASMIEAGILSAG